MYSNEASRCLRALAVAAAVAFSGGATAASPHASVVGSMPAQDAGGLINPAYLVYRDQQIYGLARGVYNYYGDPSIEGPYVQDGLFSMSSSGKFTKLREFDANDGSPVHHYSDNYTDLLLLDDGSLFGTTSRSTFTFSPAGVFNRLNSYPGGFDGPSAPHNLVRDSSGNIYGIDSGPYGFKLVAVALDGQTSVVYDFGAEATNLVAGHFGELYVTLPRDGYEGIFPRDAIFKIKDGVGTLVHVLSLDDSEGHYINDMVVDAEGNLIGGTQGDAYTDSVLFKVTPDGTFSIIHRFFDTRVTDGFGPNDLLTGADGSIYGATDWNGPDGRGSTFRVAPNGHYSVLLPYGTTGLIQGQARTIYFRGPSGANGTGAISKLVVPIQDDVIGSGTSSLIFTGPGILSTGSTTGTASDLAITTGYYPVAVGDFNGDGIADILWTSPRHDLYVWSGSPDGFKSKFAGTYPAGWTVAGAGDFDADGKDDLAWINASSHQFAYWLMDGAARKGYKVIRYTAGYYPVTVGDYDADGRADVLWSSSRHDLYAWLSRGQGFVSKFIANYPAAWEVVGRGDLDDDGNADLVWMTDDGAQWGYWLMKAGSVLGIKSFAVPAAVTGSRVATVADYNGDGVADVLWSDGQALTLWTNQGGCLDAPGCAFSQSVPGMTLSSGQVVFNSGLPASPQ